MTCKDVIAVLAEYLEAELGVTLVSDLEQHLSGCAPCSAYLNTYRKTRELGAQAGRVEMPDEMRVRLRRLLLEQLQRSTPPAPD
ncbi:MAG: anti-sigma factor family protein [Candidatus Rokuibacteriota bacterium]